MKIYFENPDTSSLESLIRSLFMNSGYAYPTYFDKKCSKLQCDGRRRSFEDLLLIANTYFKGTSEEDLMQALMNINILYYHCSHINKIVFHYNASYAINNNFEYKKEKFAEGTYLPTKLESIVNNILQK